MWGSFTDLYLDHPHISKRHKPRHPSPSFSSQESIMEDVEDVVATTESEDEAADLNEWYRHQRKVSSGKYQYSTHHHLLNVLSAAEKQLRASQSGSGSEHWCSTHHCLLTTLLAVEKQLTALQSPSKPFHSKSMDHLNYTVTGNRRSTRTKHPRSPQTQSQYVILLQVHSY